VLQALELPYDRFCFACFDDAIRCLCRTTRRATSSCLRMRGRAGLAGRGRGRRRDGSEWLRAVGVEGKVRRRVGRLPPVWVDIDAGERAVELMRASVDATRRPEVIGGLGGFASAMALPRGCAEPILVSSTDGVGTKTAIAMTLGDTTRSATIWSHVR